MIKYYSCREDGLVEMDEWQPHFWINVQSPTKSDTEVLNSLGVPESFLESVADGDERPRFDREDGWLLTIIRIPHRVKDVVDSYVTIPLGVMTKDDVIITLCHHQTEMIADFIEHCNRRHILIDNQPDFVLRLLFSSTYWFLQYLKGIKTTVVDATRDIQKSVRNEQLLNLMRQQNALVYFNTSLQGNSMLTDRLNNVFTDDCDADLLEDVEIEMAQATNTVNVYMEILSTSMDTFASIISNNVNDIMKRMTSVSIILMIPTLIASFYGMNVAVWLGASSHAFLFIVLLSFILAGIVWYLLRRSNWVYPPTSHKAPKKIQTS